MPRYPGYPRDCRVSGAVSGQSSGAGVPACHSIPCLPSSPACHPKGTGIAGAHLPWPYLGRYLARPIKFGTPNLWYKKRLSTPKRKINYLRFHGLHHSRRNIEKLAFLEFDSDECRLLFSNGETVTLEFDLEWITHGGHPPDFNTGP